MKNPIPELRQTSIISKKPGFLSEKLETLTSSNYHRVEYFYWNLAHVSYLVMSAKGFADILFCSDLELLMKV